MRKKGGSLGLWMLEIRELGCDRLGLVRVGGSHIRNSLSSYLRVPLQLS